MRTSAAHRHSRDTIPISRMPVLKFPVGHLRTGRPLPLAALGLILAVERVLDMCRTSVNAFSDSCGAVIVARLTGDPVSRPCSEKAHHKY